MSTTTPAVTTKPTPAHAARKAKPQLSEGARAERRLGFMLIAPAVIVMIAVAGYPIVYAVYLSLQRYNLEFPQNKAFIGFANYGAVLSSPYWWQALWVTLIITVFSVAITLVLGMLLAMVLHRTLFTRGSPARTAAWSSSSTTSRCRAGRRPRPTWWCPSTSADRWAVPSARPACAN